MSSIFEKNIKTLTKKNPTLAAKLFSIPTHKKFEVIQQGNDPINLNIIDTEKKYPIYETEPLKEIEEKEKIFKKNMQDILLYIFSDLEMEFL
jgi:hypothetical protein